jgi:drug/metabolite transporter (DMT)-like permease
LAALAAAALFGAVAASQASVIRKHGLWSPPMIGVVLVYGIGWLLHLVAIARLPLYLAQVGVSASLIVTALIASFILGEPLRREHWVAVIGMVGGLGVLAKAAGDRGQSHFTDRTTVALYILLIVTALLGWLVRRWHHPLSGVAIGTLAGVAYGASPIATRALVDFSWDPDTLATAISIGLFGGLGFLLYSIALNRASVTAATAPQILLQTAIPAVVGIAVFHDHVRSGWWPLAAAAFAVSLAAGIVLCGAETSLDLLEDGLDPGLDNVLDEHLEDTGP